MFSRGGISEEDLDEILVNSEKECLLFRNQEITILGGTGFIGTWLISFLCLANEKLNLNINIICPTRNINLANMKLKLKKNDPVRIIEHNFSTNDDEFTTQSKFYIIGITPTNRITGAQNSDSVLKSTQNAINYVYRSASLSKNKPKVIHLSSGAIYEDLTSPKLLEKEIDFIKSQDSYTQAKFLIEKSLEKLNEKNLIKAANPRLFAFMGPHLALNAHFAIGNFMKDCLNGNPIIVKGNPLTTRSYLYPTDLISWIIKILVNPTILPLNFGSEQILTIKEISERLSSYFGHRKVEFINPQSKISHYVPSIENTKKFLNVSQIVSFEEGIERWAKWLQKN